MYPRKPFWAYSSRNVHGYTPHPRVKYVREQVLNLWAQMHTYMEIVESLDISEDTVRTIIRRARVKGDERAIKRRYHWSRRAAKADRRREQIMQLHQAGMKPNRIAKLLAISPRMVYYRIREDNDA